MDTQYKNLFSKKTFKHLFNSLMLEFGPVILFLVSFEYMTVYESTTLLMIGTIVSTVVTYTIQKRIPYLALYVAAITLVFGFLTIQFHAVKFIQMRDTLYDLTCAVTLTLGLIFNVRFLALAFNNVIPMTNRAWDKLTHLWVVYFIVIAMSNEIIRRLYSLDTWFIFKGVVVVATLMFGFFALYYSYEEKIEPLSKD